MGRDREQAAGGARASGEGGRVLQFRHRAPSRGTFAKPISDPLQHWKAEEDRRRMLQNLAAAVVIALLTITGHWLTDRLRASARNAACVEAGHHNCTPLNLDPTR